MHILITGGTGLLGRPLAASYAADGHEVVVLTRDPAKHASNLPAGVRAHKWDARTAEGWGHLVEGADAIIHLAGENISGDGMLPSRWSAKRKQRILESRVHSGLAIVDAIEAAKNKPKMLLQASAVGYYGADTGDAVLAEDAPAGDDFLGRGAVAWEDSTKPVEEMGVRRVIARTGVVMAEDGGPLPFSRLQFKLFAGGRLGSGEQWMSWIHKHDELAALRFLVENEQAAGVFNLTAPEPVTNREFTKQLGRTMGRPAIIPAPAFAMKLALGEISTLVLDGQRAVPNRLLDLGFKFRYPEIYFALRDLLD